MSELVDRLCESDHPVELPLRPERSARNLKDWIDRNFVHVRFTDTRGGTELGFKLDRQQSDLTMANFDAPKGVVKLVGQLTLDYVSVQCIAEIDLGTLTGQGHLVRLDKEAA